MAQLTYLFEDGDSKDVDVALWQDYRAHNDMQPVRDVLDFDIVNEKLHDEFDEIKRAEIVPFYIYLWINELPQMQSSLKCIYCEEMCYEYLQLLSEGVDGLIQ